MINANPKHDTVHLICLTVEITVTSAESVSDLSNEWSGHVANALAKHVSDKLADGHIAAVDVRDGGSETFTGTPAANTVFCAGLSPSDYGRNNLWQPRSTR